MKSEEKQIKRILTFTFLFCFVYFAFIRSATLFKCARQQSDAGLPVDPLGNAYGELTPFFGFPLNLLQAQSPSASTVLSPLLKYGIILNGLFMGLVAACFLSGMLLLLVKCHRPAEYNLNEATRGKSREQ